MKVLLAHPTGNSNVRAILTAFKEGGFLSEFNTTVSIDNKADWIKYLPARIRQELVRRSFPVASDYIWTHSFLEIARMFLIRAGLNQYVQNENDWASVDSVYQSFDRAASRRLGQLVQRKCVNAVYAYEDGAFSIFKQAKLSGLKCVYDLPIAYWEAGRKLMFQEAERLPLWAPTLGGGLKDSAEKLERKTRELELADMVVVPGKFVFDTIPEWARKKKIVQVPFGSPGIQASSASGSSNRKPINRPLKVLFVGSMGQRKGLGDLFSAIKLLNRNDIELVVMGSLLAPMKFYRSELNRFTYEPGRPHEEVLSLMRSCDVLCLPSIVEGRALVMQEAMSQGLPIIITSNTGGEDLVIDGSTGFMVPIRSPEAIAKKLTWFIENRKAIGEMAIAAKKHAEKYTWDGYGSEVVSSVINYLKKGKL
jgi:glycosyltransferase involved in cell wall biosynthesis